MLPRAMFIVKCMEVIYIYIYIYIYTYIYIYHLGRICRTHVKVDSSLKFITLPF